MSGCTIADEVVSLTTQLNFTIHKGFSEYLTGNEFVFDKSRYYGTIMPRFDTYYSVDKARPEDIDRPNDVSDYNFNGFFQHGFGYRNKEQMFCHTLTSTLVESYYFNREVTSHSLSEVINKIISGYGFVMYDNDTKGKIAYIDEFGGNLSSQIKKDFLSSLLLNSAEDIEAIRFFSKEEADKFNHSCYISVGGDESLNDFDFVSPEDDYLFNSISEFRVYVSERKNKLQLDKSRQAARAAKESLIQAAQELKEQQEIHARQQALEQQRLKDVAAAEKLQNQVERQQAIRNIELRKQQQQNAEQNAKAEQDRRRQQALDEM